MNRVGEGPPGPGGAVTTVAFKLDGREFIALNGGPQFQFTEAISLYVDCEDQEEVDRLWDALTEGGEESRCGWLKDRYGLSWQIVPSVLGEMLEDQDPERLGRVMEALLQMDKIEIDVLRRAYSRTSM